MVTMKVLGICDKYRGGLRLLDERWASEKDLREVVSEQAFILDSFINKFEFLKLPHWSGDLRQKINEEIELLELEIDKEVIVIIRKQIGNSFEIRFANSKIQFYHGE